MESREPSRYSLNEVALVEVLQYKWTLAMCVEYKNTSHTPRDLTGF